MQRFFVFPSFLALLVCVAAPVSAQSVTPARDGTGTVITRDGDRYIITGGRRSGDGANLFQSFERLGLNANEIATFMTQPGIANILGRVTGGDASVINGLLQVSGGNSNLYLINPAGILFGANARLDIPGSFTATTASGIGFGTNTFNAIGENNYADLVGTPDSYAFTLSQPGAIANAGDLAVAPGESLSLIGGVVVNTGTLSAPGGKVTVAAIPGENRVRVSQDGALLSLELESINGTATNSIPFTPLSLPQLLTGGNLGNASSLTVDPDGTVRLTGAVIPDIPGTAVVSGGVDAAGTPSGEINVLGDRVALLSANLNASGLNGGGMVRIGGDYQGQGTVFNAARTVVSRDSSITADALSSGNGGRVIVWADGTTWFLGNISAQGGALSGDGGFVEVSGAQNLRFDGFVNVAAGYGRLGTLLLDPENITISTTNNPVSVSASPGFPPTIPPTPAVLGVEDFLPQMNQDDLAGQDVTISATTLANQAGTIILAATNDITVAVDLTLFESTTFNAGGNFTVEAGRSILASSGDFTVNAAGNIVMEAGSALSAFSGDITLNGADVTLTRVDAGGGAIAITGSGAVDLQDTITAGNFTADAGSTLTLGLSSSITASTGDVSLSADNTVTLNGNIVAAGRSITVTSTNGDITSDSATGRIDASSAVGDGGPITLEARSGLINVGSLNSSGTSGGNVTVTAESAITLTEINASGSSGNGGNVTLDPSGDVQVSFINADGGSSGTGGTIDITAGGFFRATSSFTNRNGLSSSISAAGGRGAGSITIRHGGDGETPFVIGDATTNGTAAAITDGVNTFRNGESFEGSITRGNLQLITNAREVAGCEGDDCSFDDDENYDDDDEFDDDYDDEDYDDYDDDSEEEDGVDLAQQQLLGIQQQTGVKPALVYVSFVSSELPVNSTLERQDAIASQQITAYLDRENPSSAPLLTAQNQDDDILELLLVLPNGATIRHRVAGVTRAMVVATNRDLLRAITSPYYLQTTRYLPPAQTLYTWMIAPLKADLDQAEIENMAFIVDSGLRTIPMAVLHDGEQFLVEQYSIGMMPSLSLTDTRYQDIRDLPVLAMGASDFDGLADLPAVPLEIATIASESQDSVQLLNDGFTLENLLQERRDRSFGIVHLATHAVFNPGALNNSFIQLGDRRLGLDQLRQLQFNNPPVELLVLSACQTALGDPSAELGFGGLAVQAGVKTVLASLWSVSDTGTLGFMSEFYHQLRSAPTRSEALRQTQLAMLRGEIRIENGQLRVAANETIALTPDLASDTNLNFRHPYYWAAFTMIGNPW